MGPGKDFPEEKKTLIAIFGQILALPAHLVPGWFAVSCGPQAAFAIERLSYFISILLYVLSYPYFNSTKCFIFWLSFSGHFYMLILRQKRDLQLSKEMKCSKANIHIGIIIAFCKFLTFFPARFRLVLTICASYVQICSGMLQPTNIGAQIIICTVFIK